MTLLCVLSYELESKFKTVLGSGYLIWDVTISRSSDFAKAIKTQIDGALDNAKKQNEQIHKLKIITMSVTEWKGL